ncbi:FtsW/RodA/SpoVE family cell cycle protein [Bifidobacterium imperatoris]|uniref:Cell division protein FtsW n=1 Tax=Bifidobacterium imperatoris TaxID=2020965 RepID=A0A2N5IPP3_9BIFI|nr:FtsW/RodA/SpoVE family cell cycle protein [Bifidobacterium imperatoris]PLS23916.1 cell division protein FtsW [Bifidobacterium imperatoris]QSY58396.1 FtsW/RodA/SpoVE family cell cycle protein [Bifidobacterium imperatoris]
MIATRLRQIGLLLISMAISALAFIQMFERTTNSIPSNYLVILCVAAALFLVLWALTVRFQPYASQAIIPCVLLLTGIGVTMIARIDQSMSTRVAQRQLMWLCIALVLSALIIVFLKDYRVLRRFSYVSMVVGLVLLLSPMLPVLGQEVNGARIWVKVPGLGQFQPGEFAKLFLAFFFAAYLFDHRDQLAVGGKKVLGLQLPRIKDLGPIIVVWVASMGVLVMQHDLGTSLMFFAMFVAMLYAATGRKSWIVIGLLAFAVGAVAAASVFSHVGQRVDAWLHPFSDEQYNMQYGGSWQLVTGIFGLASGGMVGTGLGQGHPALTTFANSDFIYTALGEELGLAGVLAILMLYLIIIASGFIAAMKIKDGFGKLLASGLVFTMAFQVFTVVGGVTLVIPLTGLTLPYMAAGGSSLIANYVLAALLIVISDAANQPEPELTSESFQYEALAVLRDKELEERARATEPIVRQSPSSGSTSSFEEIVDTTRHAPDSFGAAAEYTAPTGTLPPVPPTPQVPQVPQVPPIPPAHGHHSASNHHGPRHGGARA